MFVMYLPNSERDLEFRLTLFDFCFFLKCYVMFSLFNKLLTIFNEGLFFIF